MALEPDDLAPLREAAARSVGLGSLIFHLELAQMLARKHAEREAPHLAIDDWAVDVGPRGYEVVFLDADLEREVLTVTFAADGSAITEPCDRRAAPRLIALAQATRTLSSLPGPVERSIVVLPAAGTAAPGGTLTGYIVRTAERNGDIAVGIHWRITLSASGDHILEREAIGRSDLSIPGQNGQPAIDVVLTALDTDVPHELHVYLSLRHGIPLSVITVRNEEQWYIEGEAISLL